jgi:glycerol-3-phosphate cytidylyltransferase
VHPENKIKSRAEIVEIATRLRKTGFRIVTTNGAFDLLHVGHVKMLQEAKNLGDILIVGVNSDSSVRRFKGPHRPVNSEKDRVAMLSALTYTDYITLFDELTPVALLDQIKPHIHVNSPEHGYDCIEKEVVLRHGGEIYLSKLIEGFSTSALIERVTQVYARPMYKAIFLNPVDVFEFGSLESGPQTLDFWLLASRFLQAGYQLVILANHPEIAMGFLTEEDIINQYEAVKSSVRLQGVELAGIYFCPHHPDGKLDAYRLECTCRKPLPGLIEQAVANLDINLSRSFVVSTQPEDILMGRRINCKTILIENPSLEMDACRDKSDIPSYVGPNFKVKDFQEVLDIITR